MNPDAPEITPEMLQQNPLLMVAILALFGWIMFLIVGAITSYVIGGIRLSQGKPILPVDQPWLPRRWGFLDIILVGVAVIVCQYLFTMIAIPVSGVDIELLRKGEAGMPMSLTAIIMLGNLAAMVAGSAWIMVRYRVAPSHVGYTLNKLPRHLLAGGLVGLAAIPLTWLLMIVVTFSFDTEYTHPLIDEMTRNATLATFLMGAFTAAIVAPLTEEFLFRVVIQGWLQSIPFKSVMDNLVGGSAMSATTEAGAISEAAPMTAEAYDPERPGEIVEATLVDDADLSPAASAELSPYAYTPTATAALASATASGTSQLPPIWPSVVTGILFGLAHWGYGLSFIPLIILGTILGLVYRATHSIWPCVLIHFTLNATSMAALGVNILMQRAAN